MPGHANVCYEIFVRSFCDSNGDGIGDLPGITSRLNYLSDLGISGIWLTPVQPSPSYHKYDITDYYSIDPEYGTLEDYRKLLTKAHEFGIKVYMDFVIHHTSVQHRWFKEAQCNPDSPFRKYYRWMSQAQINEMGVHVRELTYDAHTVNPWHRINGDKERFLGIFSNDMADLNMDHPPVRGEFAAIADFWLNDVGVDGFRLDAARHIYPIWEDERNPVFWEEFGAQIRKIKPGAFLVGEVWAETAHVATFFKGLDANFNFDLSQKIEEMLLREEHCDLVGLLQYQAEAFRQVSPGYIDAIMLSNHDQQRIGSTVKGHTGKMKLAAAILLTLPGQPYIYYGEEIGMLGRKPDPYLREPFLWGDPDSETSWKRPRYSKPGKVKSLRESLANPDSLYYCYKNLIHLRNSYIALGAIANTSLERTSIENPHIAAYVRRDEDAAFLVLHNLTKTVQTIPKGSSLSEFKILKYATTQAFSFKENELHLGGYNSVILQMVPTVIH